MQKRSLVLQKVARCTCPMLTATVLFSALGALAIAGTIVTIARDGYRALPTRRFLAR